MTWTQEIFGRVIHWYDPEPARAWFLRALERSDAAAVALGDREGWNAQRRLVREAWEALGAAYRALTVPAPYDPGFGDALSQTTTTARGNLQALLHAVGERGTVLGLVWVAGLDAQSNVTTRYLDADPRQGDGGDFAGLYTGCVRLAAHAAGCDPYDWRVAAWRGGIVVGDDLDNELTVLAPPVWSLEIAQRAARYALERGMRAVVRDTVAAVAARNLREAERVGLDVGDLRGAAARAAASLEDARWNDPTFRTMSDTLLTAAAAVSTQAPPYGLVAAGIMSLGAALLRLAPAAVGNDPRTTPVYVDAVIDGARDLTRMPTILTGWPAGMPRTLPPEGALAADPNEFYTTVDAPRPGVITVGAMNAAPLRATRFAMELTGGPDGTTQRRELADAYAVFEPVDPGPYTARVVATRPDGTRRAARPARIDTTPVDVPDGDATLGRLGLDCAGWLALDRPGQLRAARRVANDPDDAAEHQRIITAVTAHCVRTARPERAVPRPANAPPPGTSELMGGGKTQPDPGTTRPSTPAAGRPGMPPSTPATTATGTGGGWALGALALFALVAARGRR